MDCPRCKGAMLEPRTIDYGTHTRRVSNCSLCGYGVFVDSGHAQQVRGDRKKELQKPTRKKRFGIF